MSKITKAKKQYRPQRLYLETNNKLQKLSRKQGKYIIEIIRDLVDKESELCLK